jgi:hypothetical protein
VFACCIGCVDRYCGECGAPPDIHVDDDDDEDEDPAEIALSFVRTSRDDHSAQIHANIAAARGASAEQIEEALQWRTDCSSSPVQPG